MKKSKYMIWGLLLFTALTAQSQSLRIVGYEGEVVLTNGDSFTVSGATLEQCQEAFEQVADEQTSATGESLYYGRSGTRACTPSFVYRSPTAPATDQSSAAVFMPRLPLPPVCLSCPVFDHPGLIKEIYPDHVQLVQKYVNKFKIDQYNKELMDLQSRYKNNLDAFEKTLYDLEQSMQNQ